MNAETVDAICFRCAPAGMRYIPQIGLPGRSWTVSAICTNSSLVSAEWFALHSPKEVSACWSVTKCRVLTRSV